MSTELKQNKIKKNNLATEGSKANHLLESRQKQPGVQLLWGNINQQYYRIEK